MTESAMLRKATPPCKALYVCLCLFCISCKRAITMANAWKNVCVCNKRSLRECAGGQAAPCSTKCRPSGVVVSARSARRSSWRCSERAEPSSATCSFATDTFSPPAAAAHCTHTSAVQRVKVSQPSTSVLTIDADTLQVLQNTPTVSLTIEPFCVHERQNMHASP